MKCAIHKLPDLMVNNPRLYNLLIELRFIVALPEDIQQFQTEQTKYYFNHIFYWEGKKPYMGERWHKTLREAQTKNLYFFNKVQFFFQVSHMTLVALPQDRAGAGRNKLSRSQFLELG